MSETILFDIIGLFGVAIVVWAYFLITSEKLTGKDVRFHVMNLAGAILILISLFNTWNTASVAIEIVWIGISLYGIWRCLRTKS